MTLIGNGDSVGMTATCTDDTFTELKSAVGTLSLHVAAKGKSFTHFMGRYAAGGGSFRIRNTSTGVIKTMGFLALNGTINKLKKTITVQDNDIIEAFTEEVPT